MRTEAENLKGKVIEDIIYSGATITNKEQMIICFQDNTFALFEITQDDYEDTCYINRKNFDLDNNDFSLKYLKDVDII